MEFLLVVLFVVLIYNLIKWYFRRKINKFFGQFGGQFNGTQFGGNQSQQQKTSDNRTSSGKSKSSRSSQSKKKKVIGSEEGKYVEFEEIK